MGDKQQPPKLTAKEILQPDAAGAEVWGDHSPVEKNALRTSAPTKTGSIKTPDGPDPTRYGDWEKKGRCVDF